MPKLHYFDTCPYCGAALDPGERCDCLDAQEIVDAVSKSIADSFLILCGALKGKDENENGKPE